MLGKGVDTFKKDSLTNYAWGKSMPESLDSFAQVKSWKNRKLACLTQMHSSNIKFPYN